MPSTTTVSYPKNVIRALIGTNILLLVGIVFLAVSCNRHELDPVLSVERLNIVDDSGNLAMVLASGSRLPGAMFNGKEYPQSFVGRGRSSGMLFYNSVGDEVGGLIFDGAPKDSGYTAMGHLSFDQWQQSQVVALTYSGHNESRMAGLRTWDRPDISLEEQFLVAEQFLSASDETRPGLREEMNAARNRVAGVERIFVGNRDRNASVELRDPAGRVRAILGVDSVGVANLRFLNESGQVVATYPEGR